MIYIINIKFNIKMTSNVKSNLKSAEIFEKMNAIMKLHGEELSKKVQSTFLFEIQSTKSKPPILFTVDMKNGNGKNYYFCYYLKF